jgi:serine/threonine protein kinase
MDVFTTKDIALNANEGFWQIEAQHKQISQPFLFGGNLLQINSQGVMSSTYYMLTCSYLISCKGSNRSLNKRSNINWKRVQAVTKGAPPTVYRGFKLSTQTCSETFYAENSPEYDTWLSYFEKFCVLGTLHEDYELLTELGRGSFSVVMKATDRRSQTFVAVKLVDKNSKGAEQCLKEVSLMRRLSHESILQVLKVYDTPDQVAIILEYVNGGTLFEYIATHKRISEDEARVLMTKLLGGLEYCHSKLCVHRDLKLENVLLAHQDDLSSIKIADFGLAADLEIEQLGKRCGSAGYVAPEILLDRPQSDKVDVFSAGVILYMCLSGTAPFCGDLKAKLRSNEACVIDLETEYWAHISTTGKDIVRRLMMKEPFHRLSSTEAISHIWLTKLEKLEKLARKPPKIQLRESPITQSPRVTSKKMTETITKRTEESKSNYLTVIPCREVVFMKSSNSPSSPNTPNMSLTPCGFRRRTIMNMSNPTTPSSPAYATSPHPHVQPTFGELSKKMIESQDKKLTLSSNPGDASVKSRILRPRQKSQFLEVVRRH